MTIYLTYIMEFNKQNIQSKVTTAETHVIDEGLRAYMLKVYNYHGFRNIFNWYYFSTSF